jgi:uncharacterized protein (TIGR02118 family)
MNDQFDSVIVYVTYQGTTETRFDKDYYVEHHLPLVIRSWAACGLESVSAFFPAAQQKGTIAICECRFRNEAAIAAAFTSPQAGDVIADVQRFTDVTPQQSRGVAL